MDEEDTYVADEGIDPYAEDQGAVGLSPVDSQLLNMLQANYTTQEAKELAKRTYQELDQERTESRELEDTKLKQMGATAETAKAELKAARERLLAKRYSNSEFWFSAAQGFGTVKPGGSGHFIEGLGQAAGNVVEPLRKKREWEDARDVRSLEYLLKTGQIDDQQAARELAVIAARQKGDNALMREAMKIMGKEVRPGSQMGNKGMDAMDRAYAKDYIDFIQNGAAEGTRALNELKSAARILNSQNDNLTGPIVGLIPKIARDVGLPESSNVQEMVEYTVQQSLRPILGAQFTEKEGERLISRVYNPRLSEEVNARRLGRLIMQLDRAFKNKQKAAAYFEKYGTLRGYKGQTRWGIDDVWSPTDSGGRLDLPPEEGSEYEGREVISIDELPQPEESEGMIGGSINRWKKRLGFADGGMVDDAEALVEEEPGVEPIAVKLPDGRVVLVPEGATRNQIMRHYGLEEDGIGFDEVTDAGLGAALAGLGTKYGIKAGFKVNDMVRGTGIGKGERRIIDMVEAGQNGGLSPDQWADQLARHKKLGVPAMAMDVASPELRGLAEAAMTEGHSQAPSMLEELDRRQAGQRERVGDRINKALAPDEFFDQEQKLLTNLYTNSKPLYAKAYEAHPAVSTKQLMKIMDTPSGKKAVKKAIEALKDQPGTNIGKTDALGMIRKPSLAFLDEVKRQLDDMVRVEERSGATGKGKRIRELRNALRAELDEATKDPNTGKSLYTEARGQYAGDLEVLDALRMGREDFHRMAPKEVENLVNSMSFAEKDALRTGAAQKLFELIDQPSSETNAARKIAGSPAMLGRMRPLFASDKQFELFKEALQAEMDMYDQSKGVIRRGESARMSQINPKNNFFRRMAEKVPRLAPYSPTAWVMNLLRSKPNLEDKEADAILKLMRAQDPNQIRQLQRKVGRTKTRKKIAGRAGTVAGLAAAVAPFLGGGDDEPDPLGDMPEAPLPGADDPSLEGLTPEERKWAMQVVQ